MKRTTSSALMVALTVIPLSAVVATTAYPVPVDAAHKKATPKKTATPKARKTQTPTPTPRPTATPEAVNGIVAGPVVDTQRWGPIQATITVQAHRITDVSIDAHPDTSRSQLIDDRALPILRQETLQAQSANIHTVSGATITSQAYIRSLQGALDKANM